MTTASPTRAPAAHASHGGHSPNLAHHFDSMGQQFGAAKIGMWVFLATEILMFGGLFVAYSVWRANHPEVFLYAHTKLQWQLGAINTVFLIGSSFTMACAVRAAQLGQKRMQVLLLTATIAGGLGFMVVKTFEYGSKIKHALWVGSANQFHPDFKGEKHPDGHGETAEHASSPAAGEAVTAAAGAHAAPPAPPVAPAAHAAPTIVGLEPSTVTRAPAGPPGLLEAPKARHVAHHSLTYDQLTPRDQRTTHQFFQIYFLMTGLHTLHVIIGVGLILWVAVRASRGAFTASYFTPVDMVGLYWHLVDLIWIFLFPLLYLIH